MSNSTVDLHVHSTASDGASTPNQIIELASRSGIKYLAFADHESINSFLSTNDMASQAGITLTCAVELLTSYRGREIHLLGYGMDYTSPMLHQWLRELRESRNMVAEEIISRFRHHGYHIDYQRVLEIASPDVAIGKNHIVYALAEAGYIKNKEDIIHILRYYLSENGLAYVHFGGDPLPEAVRLIREAGGIPVLAHPGLIRDESLVYDIVDNYQVGLEVYYYYFGEEFRNASIRTYSRLADAKGCLKTGGSDYHGRFSPDVSLGAVHVPEQFALDLINAWQKKEEEF